MPNTEESIQLDERSTEAADNFNNFVVFMFIFEVFLKAMFKSLIGTLTSMQLLVHLGIIGAKIPPNALMIINKMKPIVSFALIKEFDKLNDLILKFDYKTQAALVL